MKITKYSAILLISIFLSVISGYYFKKPDSMMLSIVSEEATEWKKDLRIEAFRSKIGLFELTTSTKFIGADGKPYSTTAGNFEFNWLAFIVSYISSLTIALLLTNTNFLEFVKHKSKSHLK